MNGLPRPADCHSGWNPAGGSASWPAKREAHGIVGAQNKGRLGRS